MSFILTHGNQVQVFAVNDRALDILNLSKWYYFKMDPFKDKKIPAALEFLIYIFRQVEMFALVQRN